jgi:hypothetical protein
MQVTNSYHGTHDQWLDKEQNSPWIRPGPEPLPTPHIFIFSDQMDATVFTAPAPLV